MAKIFGLSICMAVLLVPLACRSRPGAPPRSQEPATMTEVEDEETAPPDPNDVATLKRNVIRQAVVTSKYQTLDGSRVLKYTNSLVPISVSVQDIIDYFEKHPNWESHRVLADRLREEASTHLEYRYQDFSRTERERLHYCLAALLEEGEFVLTLSGTGRTVSQISVCEYSRTRGFLDGIGGRIFSLEDGRAFFITYDWIS